jgi:hypothetical protein
LRRSCPARNESPPLDLKIAERVLADPVRYGEAVSAIHPIAAPPLHSGQTPAGAALTAVNGSLSSKPRIP